MWYLRTREFSECHILYVSPYFCHAFNTCRDILSSLPFISLSLFCFHHKHVVSMLLLFTFVVIVVSILPLAPVVRFLSLFVRVCMCWSAVCAVVTGVHARALMFALSFTSYSLACACVCGLVVYVVVCSLAC